MLDSMKLSRIDPEYQYKIFINKNIKPDTNIDIPGLVEFLTAKYDAKIGFLYGGAVIISLIILIGFYLLTWYLGQAIGFGFIFSGIVALIFGIGMSGKNAKIRHIGYFVFLFFLFKHYNLSIEILGLGFLIWFLNWLFYFLMLKRAFLLLEENRMIFLDCCDEHLISIFFDDNNIQEAQKFMKMEGISKIPTDPLFMEKSMGIKVKPVR